MRLCVFSDRKANKNYGQSQFEREKKWMICWRMWPRCSCANCGSCGSCCRRGLFSSRYNSWPDINCLEQVSNRWLSRSWPKVAKGREPSFIASLYYVLSNYAVSFGFFPSSIIKACKWELTIAALGFEPASAWFATATKLWYWCSYLSGCISEFFRKMRTISKIYLPLLIR